MKKISELSVNKSITLSALSSRCPSSSCLSSSLFAARTSGASAFVCAFTATLPNKRDTNKTCAVRLQKSLHGALLLELESRAHYTCGARGALANGRKMGEPSLIQQGVPPALLRNFSYAAGLSVRFSPSS